jgi:hypothetical protein
MFEPPGFDGKRVFHVLPLVQGVAGKRVGHSSADAEKSLPPCGVCRSPAPLVLFNKRYKNGKNRQTQQNGNRNMEKEERHPVYPRNIQFFFFPNYETKDLLNSGFVTL